MTWLALGDKKSLEEILYSKEQYFHLKKVWADPWCLCFTVHTKEARRKLSMCIEMLASHQPNLTITYLQARAMYTASWFKSSGSCGIMPFTCLFSSFIFLSEPFTYRAMLLITKYWHTKTVSTICSGGFWGREANQI